MILEVRGCRRGGFDGNDSFGHGGNFSGQCGFFGSHGVVVGIMAVGTTVMDLIIVETVSEVVEINSAVSGEQTRQVQ